MYSIYQDGNTFYCESEVIFVSKFKVKDGDMLTARLARNDFKEWWNKNHPMGEIAEFKTALNY
jgi:hypothetical protein